MCSSSLSTAIGRSPAWTTVSHEAVNMLAVWCSVCGPWAFCWLRRRCSVSLCFIQWAQCCANVVWPNNKSIKSFSVICKHFFNFIILFTPMKSLYHLLAPTVAHAVAPTVPSCDCTYSHILVFTGLYGPYGWNCFTGQDGETATFQSESKTVLVLWTRSSAWTLRFGRSQLAQVPLIRRLEEIWRFAISEAWNFIKFCKHFLNSTIFWKSQLFLIHLAFPIGSLFSWYRAL